ncbi:uncharacterized protein LOC128200087 [Galleria mellonella]|uniref:Uncharacterized protein LOC128200087 n=1 Tax=Galleria mellonella TaxID=7137 RepID=A0ABM3MAT6_GALME|nr:uncharacterized protein LOC128200087 [Galleria mellonella]
MLFIIADTSVSSSTSASPLSSALPQSTASDYEVIRSNTIVNGDPVSSTEEIIVERPSLNIPTNPWERVQQLGNNLQQTATSAAETDIENLVYTTLQELWELWNLWSQRRGQLGLPPLSLPSSGSSNSGPRRWIDRSEVGNVCVCYDDSKYIPWNVRRQIAA